MPPPLRTLIAATTATPRLILALQQGGFEVDAALADSPDGLAQALAARPWDLVLVAGADVPAEAVVAAVRASQLDLPVVVVQDADVEGAAAVVAPAGLDDLGPALTRLLSPDGSPPPPSASSLMPLTAAAAADPTFIASDAGAVQALAEHLPVGLYQSTPDGRILFANEALASVLSYGAFSDLERLDVRRDLGYPRELFEEQIRRFGEVRNLVVEWRTPSGVLKVTRENARAVRDEDGAVLYYEGTMEDITAEHTARARERRRNGQLAAIVRFATLVDEAASVQEVYEAAVDTVSVSMETPLVMLMARKGDETHCVATSDALPEAAVRLFEDMRLGDMLPLHTQPVLLRDEQGSRRVQLPDAVRDVMRNYGVRAVGSFPLIHHGRPHGAFIVLYADAHTFTDEELQVAETLAWHIAGSLARHRAESSLRDSEACLRFIAENTAHVLYRLRYETGGFDYLSPASEALTGYTLDELEARGGLVALVREREVIQGDGLMQGPPEEGAEGHYLAVYRIETKSGDDRYVENNAYVWHDAQGQAVGMVGVLQDVTERKRREDEQAEDAARSLALQKALVELASLEDTSPASVIERGVAMASAMTDTARVGVWLVNDGARTMECRALYLAVGGLQPPDASTPLAPYRPLIEALERHRTVSVETRDDPMVARMQAADYFAERGIGALLVAAVRRHGRVIGMVSLMHEGEGRTWTPAEQDFAAAVADVVALALERADRHAAETAKQESDGRYRAISELASDYAFAVHIHPDGTGGVAWATEAFTRITGFEVREVDGLDVLSRLVHPDALDAAAQAFVGQQDGQTIDLETRIVTKSGEERWVYHRARRVEEPDGTVILYNTGQDITERKRFEHELIAAREAAEEMARLKSAFLANMSHEIRTPLTGILGYAGLLAEEVRGEHREFVQFIEKSGRRLLDTLNSVLDLARLEAGGFKPTLEILDMAAEAHQAVQMLAPLAGKRGIDLRFSTTEKDAHVRTDRTCLNRILVNLIGNAIKFTEEGHVRVEIEVQPADIIVRVCDTGVGIDPAFVPFLFDEFRQETAGQDRSHEGSGLGLAITNRLVELLGGSISVESQRPGGSTFSVQFPRLATVTHATTSGDGAGHHETPLLLRPTPSDAPTDAPTDFVQTDDDMLMINGLAWDDDALDVSSPAPDAPDDDAIDPEAVAESLRVFFGGALEAEEPAEEPGSERDGGHAPASFRIPEARPSTEQAVSEPVAPEPVVSEPVVSEPVVSDNSVSEQAVSEPVVSEHTVSEQSGIKQASWDQAVPQMSKAEPVSTEPVSTEPVSTEPVSTEPVSTEPASTAPASAEPASAAPASAEPASADPAAPAAVPSAPAVPELTPIIGGTRAEPPAADEGDERPTVLVIEDNDDTRMLLVRILQRGYRVEAVGDALSGLDLMRSKRYDALVLDINLGGKQTGVDVLGVARGIEGYETVFAIALTAYALPGDRERFLEAGFDRYVSKPFTRSTLMAALSAGVPLAT